MASIATHVRGAVPASVEDAEDTQASIAPVVHKKKDVSNKVKENFGRDGLTRHLRGEIEWLTSGSIDVFTKNEVIEGKHYKNWKSGIGQVISYGAYYPSHKKRLHLFAHKGEHQSTSRWPRKCV